MEYTGSEFEGKLDDGRMVDKEPSFPDGTKYTGTFKVRIIALSTDGLYPDMGHNVCWVAEMRSIEEYAQAAALAGPQLSQYRLVPPTTRRTVRSTGEDPALPNGVYNGIWEEAGG